ncbi:MAG: beta-hydroxyacyl-ACP dehydratase [Proteobacteria bacterium]|nr:beta-hydroxyacyl-ACP dehydratase [Pseudomonadota bacterium]MBU1389817.1 beta-hydroxyacyl-ACP dehydratase [Pseudomonadota bacterium]MBU1543826.1 beta-hydroxyacyl-ACP dehydratase [Pseudomonadota bacterium]MBU2430404.1 beta-hydroxyacyl-ACP dehydratase [Pseudomonadota bacterium]MBU2482359.1 beta-hydroxyacyl-ACP dehydratase [Pseudomonadota bacterium]
MEGCTVADKQNIRKILDIVPQKPPFRFIDDILEIDENKITAVYRFREDEDFYKGHFPGQPITPGVILIETMAQASVVAMGIHLLLCQGLCEDEIRQIVALFTCADKVEFNGLVMPGEKVIIRGEKIYFRRGVLKAMASLERENGELICSGILAGARG